MLMTIFDKSFIHGINADEAAVFDAHFMSNITPLFFVEVLGDLEKTDVTDAARRSALVQSLAGKTPVFRSYPNIPHDHIVLNELLGNTIEMRCVPLVGGGRRVRTKDGLGTVFDEPPEMRAKARWHEGKFEEAEYQSAREWRAMLKSAPGSMAQFVGGNPARFSFRDLEAIKHFVDKLIDGDGTRFRTLKGALDALDISLQHHARIIALWKEAGGPRLREFAPYSAHVFSVDLFSFLGMASGLIDPDKTSNYVDMAYLYYLPFCEFFVSTDKLHRRCVPLFLTGKQAFVWGADLRTALAELVKEYLAHPDIDERGLIGIASLKRFEPDSFIGQLYKRVRPEEDMIEPEPSRKLTQEEEKKLVQDLSLIWEAPSAGTDARSAEEDSAAAFQRMVPLRRGRFQFLPKKVLQQKGGGDGGEDTARR